MILSVNLTTREVELVKRSDLPKRLARKSPCVMIDVGRALIGFRRSVGSDTTATFGLDDVTTFAGLSKDVAYDWLQFGILRPTVQPAVGGGVPVVFSWVDAFVAGLLGTLHRNGVRKSVLKAIAFELAVATNKRRKIAASMDAQHAHQN